VSSSFKGALYKLDSLLVTGTVKALENIGIKVFIVGQNV